ncbi:MAG: CpaF family protein [Acidimicrobiales bacterium]|nr:CpaF family protein [Acidimicrobiales bacterium]
MTTVDEVVHRHLLDRAGAELPGRGHIAELIRRMDPLLPADEVAAAVARVTARVSGLGPLESLLADPLVSDVLVNGPGPVWMEREGVLERTSLELDRPTIELIIERVLAPLGRRVDPLSPVADGRLADGSRVHVIVPPLAVDGPCLTIRRFGARAASLDDMAAPHMVDLLRWAVRSRCNVLVVGATGSGKTTLLNAMAAHIPPHERVVTVEDAAELRLPSEHVIRLETRPASAEGTPAVTARELVRNALRMRPDRLIIGEVRSGEALDLVQAMNTGHNGSLSTLHANGCNDALHRLETLVLLAGVGLPLDAVRSHLAAAVDLVVHVERAGSGVRRVVAVAEVASGPPAPGEAPAVRLLADAERVIGEAVRGSRLSAGDAP